MFDLSVAEHVAYITIDRGSRRNAVPMRCWTELEQLVRAANMSDARAIVIRSADDESFCAGSDLTELADLKNDNLLRKKFRGAMASVFDRIRAVNKPTISLIRGGCFGTGVSLAAACDLRVAHPGASFAVTPARFGISYPQADLRRLVELVGPGQAAKLVYCGDPIDGTEAARIGLVEIVDDGDPFGAETIARIVSNAPRSLRALKATLQGRFGLDEQFDASFGSEDFSSGMDAFMGKQPARFCGR